MSYSRVLTRRRISRNIREAMHIQKVTRKKMSDDLKIKYTTLCDYVKGRTSPSMHDLKRIVDYLELDINTIYEAKEETKTPPILKLKLIEKLFNNSKTNVITLNGIEYVKKAEIEKILKYE